MTTITDPHADLTTRALQYDKVRACLEGEDVIKQQGALYLPKPSGQSQDAYLAYTARASFYAVCERTMRGLSGLVFRNKPVAELPDRMLPMLENLTTELNSFDVLVQEMIEENLTMGRYGILVDYPGLVSPSAMPRFATYKSEDIVNWSVQNVGGERVVTRVVLGECSDDDGAGNEVEDYLELSLIDGVYTVRRYTSTSSGEPVMTTESTPSIGGKTLSRIPFVFVSPYNLKPGTVKPPFLDLANMNLAHYRNSADYEHALYLTAQPTPWVSGVLSEAEKPRSIGSATIWYLPTGSQAGMLEFSGAGLAAQRQAMLDKEDRMAALGARMIRDASNASETAETTRLRGRAESSLLISTVTMVEAALKEAFGIAADWVGASRDDVNIRINKDFIETRLSAQELTALVAAWQSGAVSRETMHENLQRGEIIAADRTWEDEKEAIDEEGGGIGVTAAAAVKQQALQPAPVPAVPEDATPPTE